MASRRWIGLMAAVGLSGLGLIVSCDRSTPPAEKDPAPKQRAPRQSSAAPEEESTGLVSIPITDLTKLGNLVQKQIRDRQTALSTIRQKPDASVGKLAIAFGDMGRYYQTYDFFDAAEACYRNAHQLAPQVYAWPYYLGHLYRRRAKLDKAVKMFESALERKPDSIAALVALADTHLLANRLDQAETWFKKALELDASCAAAMAGRGKIAASRRDFTAAVEHFEAALKAQPNADAIHYSLAMAYRSLGNREEAAAHLEKRGKVAAGVADPLMAELERLRTGGRFFEQRGVSSGEAGKLTDALRDIHKAIEADPKNATAHANLGTALGLSGQTEAAIEAFREALRLDPEFVQAHFNLAVLLDRQGASDEAVEHFRQAIQRDPQYLDAQLGLADLLATLGDHETAVSHYAQAIKIDPAHRAARLRQAVALGRAGRYAEARQRLQEGRSVLPESMILAHAMARLLAASPDATVRDGQRALQLASAVFKIRKSVEHAETVAMAYAELGNYEQAKRWQTQALSVAQKEKQVDAMPRLRENLALYQDGNPCRSPWPTNAQEQERPRQSSFPVQ